MPKKQIRVIQEFVEPADKRIIRSLGRQLDSRAEKIRVYSLSRVGKTGARLYRGFIDGGRALIFKIHKPERIEEEIARVESVKLYFDDSDIFGKQVDKNLGVIAYRHAGGQTREQTKGDDTFEDYILDPATATADLVKAVERLYDNHFQTVRSKVRRLDYRLGDVYARDDQDYLRRYRASHRIATVLGEDPLRLKKEVDLFGRTFANPLVWVQEIVNSTRSLAIGPIHGDLHPRNIVLDYERRPRLIDFGWADRNFHVLVDYVLLEISLRFFLAPNCWRQADAMLVNEQLLEEDGCTRITVNGSCDEIKLHHERLKNLLPQIRAAARKAGADGYMFKEYLLSLYLVLFGVMKFHECDAQLGTHALAAMASHFQRTGV